MSVPLLEVISARREFVNRHGADHVAVDDVSLAVENGGAVGIIGESGSGKTTLARMICGLERMDAGRIALDGRPIRTSGPTNRQRRELANLVQMVFQDPFGSMDPRQTPRHGLHELLQRHGYLKSECRARAVELLELVGLGARQADALPRQLSGGERQRVAIARALTARPSLLVLDEPVSALDVSVQAQILELIRNLRREEGLTVLLITHDLAVARQLCDELLVMLRGRVVERGPVNELLDRPTHRYTRQLISAVPRPGWDPTTLDLDLEEVS